ncbi:MAG TPA: CDP-diacylglycerol--glycerol-3-phosphate 3-phosphatidyltransferase [Candidatus Omnitrophota bacterium]|nr:CDP-diacylglycerol--glycerol-3-phosphate 3-phosphatidyltransferase [Candidatus Omnitrophota bacterium]
MNLANWITLLRILLIPFFITAIVYYDPSQTYFKWIAFSFFVAACITDAIDGLIARVRKEKTTLGSFLDPFADKLLILAAFLCVNLSPNYTRTLPLWVLIIIVSREFLLVSGLLILFFSQNKIIIEPNLLGKFTTVVQMITAGALLGEFSWAPYPAYLAAFLTILSGMTYIIREARRLNHGSPAH